MISVEVRRASFITLLRKRISRSAEVGFPKVRERENTFPKFGLRQRDDEKGPEFDRDDSLAFRCHVQKARAAARGVMIPTLDPAPEMNFNSFWDLWQFRFRIWIQEKVDS